MYVCVWEDNDRSGLKTTLPSVMWEEISTPLSFFFLFETSLLLGVESSFKRLCECMICLQMAVCVSVFEDSGFLDLSSECLYKQLQSCD